MLLIKQYIKIHKKAIIFLTVFLVILLLFLRPILPYLPQTFNIAKNFFTSTASDLRSHNGRTNVLVLGLGGPKNEPSGLTDTIIFASIDAKTNQVLLLSIPRDVWIPQMRAKINSAYYYGNRADGVGMEWARDFTSEIVGQPVHYVVVVSFSGFIEMIDLLGGVDVIVDRGFKDERYPIPGREVADCEGDSEVLCRYESISFEEGRQHLDGSRALKFARSRNAEGDEGTDFARSMRQQKIILAVKEKMLSPWFFLEPTRVSRSVEIMGRSVETDIPESSFASFVHLALSAQGGNIRSEVLNDGVESLGLLINPPLSAKHDNQWVLVPTDGDWEPTREWVECLLLGKECPAGDFTREIKGQ